MTGLARRALLVVVLLVVVSLLSTGVAGAGVTQATLPGTPGYHYDAPANVVAPTRVSPTVPATSGPGLRAATHVARAGFAEGTWSSTFLISSRRAAKGETELYRAVSDDELDDIAQHGFRPGRNTMETKLFATSADDARVCSTRSTAPNNSTPTCR